MPHLRPDYLAGPMRLPYIEGCCACGSEAPDRGPTRAWKGSHATLRPGRRPGPYAARGRTRPPSVRDSLSPLFTGGLPLLVETDPPARNRGRSAECRDDGGVGDRVAL